MLFEVYEDFKECKWRRTPVSLLKNNEWVVKQVNQKPFNHTHLVTKSTSQSVGCSTQMGGWPGGFCPTAPDKEGLWPRGLCPGGFDLLLCLPYRFSNIKHQIMAWPWNLDNRSLKVIQTGTIWKTGYSFLFAFCSTYGSTLYYFWDKARYWSKIHIFHIPC